jgi:hypothetical protein
MEGSMNMKISYAARYAPLSIVCALSGFFAGCLDGGTGPNDDPAFSNLTKLNDGHRYVAYLAPPNQTEKLDTIRFTFKYNSSKINAILVQATLDSGKTWITISEMTPNNSNSASLQWVPKDAAQTMFNFFGFKECYLRISDPATDEHITSDTFQTIGAIPFVLISPTGGETYGKTDSIKVLFSNNQDITGNVEVCAKAGPAAPDWARNFGTTVLISKTLPVKQVSTTFVPQEVAQEKPDYFDFTYPLLVLLADYGPNGKRITSGEIIVQ